MKKLPTLKECLKYNDKELQELIQKKVNILPDNKINGYKEYFTNNKKLQKIDKIGIPIAIKDNMNVKNWNISCCSKILKNNISTYNSTIINKLLDNGFSPFGTTNMDEFAMGSTTENSCYGKTTNPYNVNCVPGGSSGGSAAVVASGVAIAALGSDTGGSIRQPAAFCGVVGFKPSYGSVSRNGLIAYSSSLDQIGPITQNVEDCAILYDVIKGYDYKDTTSIKKDYLSTFNRLDKDKKYTIGIVKEYINNCEEDLKNDIYKNIEILKENGHTIKEIKLFDTELSLSTYYILATAEASSNLSRFDGIRNGERINNDLKLDDFYINNRSEGFGEEVKKRILLGTFVLSSGYYDAYYNKAKKIQQFIKNKFNELFKEMDLIIMPVAPTTAFEFNKKLSPLQMYLEDIYTTPINISGLPAMSVPLSFDSKGLPTALQIVSSNEKEQDIFNLALYIESKNKKEIK